MTNDSGIAVTGFQHDLLLLQARRLYSADRSCLCAAPNTLVKVCQLCSRDWLLEACSWHLGTSSSHKRQWSSCSPLTTRPSSRESATPTWTRPQLSPTPSEVFHALHRRICLMLQQYNKPQSLRAQGRSVSVLLLSPRQCRVGQCRVANAKSRH